MDIVYGAAIVAGALFLFSTASTAKASSRLHDYVHIDSPKFDVRGCHAVDEIVRILTKNGKTHDVIVDSMNLMLYQIANPDVDLSQLVPVDGGIFVETGRNYLSRFSNVVGNVFYFLAGVIENEVETIRLDVDMSYTDKESVRKLIDIFYYKELK